MRWTLDGSPSTTASVYDDSGVDKPTGELDMQR